MKSLFVILILIFTFSAQAKFVLLENYQLDEVEIDCFSQTPKAYIYTNDAGTREVVFDSTETCHRYLSANRKVFYECHEDNGLNRFEVDENERNVEHSFKIDSKNNCSKSKIEYTSDYFSSVGV